MTELIAVPQTNPWSKLKTLVLDSVSSAITKRVYNLGLDEFFCLGSARPKGPLVQRTSGGIMASARYKICRRDLFKDVL